MTAGLSVVVAAAATLVLSSVYYGVLGSRLAALSRAYATPRPAGTTIAVEVARNLVLAAALAFGVSFADLDVGSAFVASVIAWIAFPVVLLSGSVYHERAHPQLAVIHAGDWLIKLAAMVSIIAAWR